MTEHKGYAIHWGGVRLGEYTKERAFALVRGVQRYHMDTVGVSDIEYNWMVDRHGQIFEGRGFGVRSAANGSTLGNRHYEAICFLGGPGDEFTAAAQRSIKSLMKPGLEVKTHNDVRSSPTTCPGPVITTWVRNGCPVEAPSYTKTEVVTPMFNPPFVLQPIVDAQHVPNGSRLLGLDGSVYCFGAAAFHGSASGKDYFKHTTAARWTELNDAEKAANKQYVFLSAEGNRYAYPE